MASIFEATIIHHVVIVLLVLWLLNSCNRCSPIAYFLALVYICLVHDRYVMRLRKKVRFEERRYVNQRRALSDSETVRWLNYAIEKIWPVCMEDIVSKKILLPIIPWFLEKYKPWTVKEAVVQELYLGRSPPMFTDIRVLRDSGDGDHLALELGMNFQTANDMSGLLAAKLSKRLGLGIWTKLHLVGMHVEGKVLVGVKFINHWPYLGRLRVCFAEPPYFQMMVKPLFAHGLDVSELPGVAGWLDKLLSIAFEQTLVEPNMLVVDVEKFASPQQGSWFSVDVKEPVAYAIVEVLEAEEMKPSDLNGLADPYVKGQLGPYRFRTRTQRKTLAPKWQEEFKIPICTWESPILKINAFDKDRLIDDKLGECSINIGDLRDGQRHDMWLSLQNIKVGRLHLAITVVEAKGNEKVAEDFDGQNIASVNGERTFANDTNVQAPSTTGAVKKSKREPDRFEPIDIEGQRETGIWVQYPGSEVSQTWTPRKGKSRVTGQIHSEIGDGGSVKSTGSESFQDDGSSGDESVDVDKSYSKNPLRRGWRKMGSVFHRSQKGENRTKSSEEPVSSPHDNVKSEDTKVVGVKIVVDDDNANPSFSSKSPKTDGKESSDGSGLDSPKKGRVRNAAKSIIKQAGKSAHDLSHALGRKLSTKSRTEVGSSTKERDLVAECGSSGEQSFASSVETPRDGEQAAPNVIPESAESIVDEETTNSENVELPNASECHTNGEHKTVSPSEAEATEEKAEIGSSNSRELM